MRSHRILLTVTFAINGGNTFFSASTGSVTNHACTVTPDPPLMEITLARTKFARKPVATRKALELAEASKMNNDCVGIIVSGARRAGRNMRLKPENPCFFLFQRWQVWRSHVCSYSIVSPAENSEDAEDAQWRTCSTASNHLHGKKRSAPSS